MVDKLMDFPSYRDEMTHLKTEARHHQLERPILSNINLLPSKDAVDDWFQLNFHILIGIKKGYFNSQAKNSHLICLDSHFKFPFLVFHQIFCLQGMQLTTNSSKPLMSWLPLPWYIYVSKLKSFWLIYGTMYSVIRSRVMHQFSVHKKMATTNRKA